MPAVPVFERHYYSELTPMVTGATGGIGRRLTERLTHTPDGRTRNVVAFARNSEKAKKLFEETPGVIIAKGDLTDPKSMLRAIEQHGIDIIFHVGGSLSLRDVADNQASTIEASRNLLDIATNSKIKKLIYTSSIATIGKQDPQYEQGTAMVDETNPTRGATPYGKGKIAVEQMLLNQDAVPTTIVRPSDVIGPGMHAWTGIVLGHMREKHVKPYLNKRVMIPYVDVDNLVDLHLLAAQKDEALGQIFLGVDKEIAFKELYQLYQDALDITAFGIIVPHILLKGVANAVDALAKHEKIDPAFVDMANHFVTRKHLSSQKAEEKLGWTHRNSLEQSIENVVLYERNK